MAEGTYEYECMRAELLGVEAPDYDDFVKRQEERAAAAEEDHDIELLKDTEADDGQMKHISGGLDEISSILQVTQKKINRFKASCSSLTSLLKFKLGHASSSESVDQNGVKHDGFDAEEQRAGGSQEFSADGEFGSDGGPRRSDLAKALDSHVDRLDAMIEKADNAQYSMAHQTNEIKRFLN